VPELDVGPLFTPLTINGLTVPNRFVMPGMQRALADDGTPRTALADIYRERVEGGVGLVISESTAIDHDSAYWQRKAVRMHAPTHERWSHIISSVKGAGGTIFVQLWHPGAMRTKPPIDTPTLSPSGLTGDGGMNGRAMTTGELEEIKASYVRAALDSQRLGADGVEVHGAHGYLIDQFLWARTNRRTDGYGGDDIADRVRFPAEVVAAIRAAVGPAFPISFRFSQWKEIDFTASIVDGPEALGVMVRALRAAGVDVFHVSARRLHAAEWPGSDLGLAGWTKSLTDVPVIAVGSVGLSADLQSNLWEGAPVEPEVAAGLRRVLDRFTAGEFDAVAVGRSLLADPQWVAKVRAGQFDDVIPFTSEVLMAIVAEWAAGPAEEAHGITESFAT
jgi:2,4-dienoyl-CoA reductase-like NADH-dependent reductase (Old Yellow Enzyme family)